MKIQRGEWRKELRAAEKVIRQIRNEDIRDGKALDRTVTALHRDFKRLRAGRDRAIKNMMRRQAILVGRLS